MATNSPTKQINQDGGGKQPAAPAPATPDPASQEQARQPANPEPAKPAAGQPGKESAVAVTIPRYDALLALGKKPSEALAMIDAAVAKAVTYAKVMRSTHGHEPDFQPRREDIGPYRVTETKERVNYGGGLTTIPAGTIVDLRSYGLNGIARLREQGVKMVLIEE